MRALNHEQLLRLADLRHTTDRLLLRIASCAAPFELAAIEAVCSLVLARKSAGTAIPDTAMLLDASAFVAIEDLWDSMSGLSDDLRGEIEAFMAAVLVGNKPVEQENAAIC